MHLVNTTRLHEEKDPAIDRDQGASHMNNHFHFMFHKRMENAGFIQVMQPMFSQELCLPQYFFIPINQQHNNALYYSSNGIILIHFTQTKITLVIQVT